MLPRFQGANDASGHHNRSRYSEVGIQVHGIDAEGKVIVRRQMKRSYVLVFIPKLSSCLVGIEACATSHHWSHELKALGHTVRLMLPA